MQILAFSDAALKEAITVLKNGGVIAHATETCYGLACDLREPLAVKKLFTIKQRPESQPVSGLFATVDIAKKWVVWNKKADELAKQYLPGPLTLILPIRPDAPAAIFPTLLVRETLGVRISSHKHAQKLAQEYGAPLTTTSANVHGKPNPYSAEDIVNQFADQEFKPDLILDSGTLPHVPPSTVINLTTDDDKTLRSGTIKL
ncbi:threonylcarbamoyl-AMP synthase [Candidatus Peribacteria bacterium]|nr:MAG: threonylcarbamoyl-AMP synthase [Candidatus Peribacteria bacterium]